MSRPASAVEGDVSPLPHRSRRDLIALAILGAVAAALLAAILAAAPEARLVLKGLALAALAAGRYVVLVPALTPDAGLSPMLVASVVVVLETGLAAVLLLYSDLLHRIPWLGRRLELLESSGRDTLNQRDWLRRLALAGVALVVLLPLPGTGAVGGALVGRLAGLPLGRVIVAVFVGSALGAAAFAVGATGLAMLLDTLRETVWFDVLRIGLLAALVLLGVVLARLGQKGRRRGPVARGGLPTA